MKKIKYKSINVKGNFNGKTGQQLVLVGKTEVTLQELAIELSEVATIRFVKSMTVMTGIIGLMVEKLAEGKSIKIEGLGTIRCGLSQENGQPTIKKLYISPCVELKNRLQAAQFEKVES